VRLEGPRTSISCAGAVNAGGGGRHGVAAIDGAGHGVDGVSSTVGDSGVDGK